MMIWVKLDEQVTVQAEHIESIVQDGELVKVGMLSGQKFTVSGETSKLLETMQRAYRVAQPTTEPAKKPTDTVKVRINGAFHEFIDKAPITYEALCAITHHKPENNPSATGSIRGTNGGFSLSHHEQTYAQEGLSLTIVNTSNA